MSIQGFWGFELMPGHKYSQVISVPFQILMATLADIDQQKTKSSVNIIVDQKEFVLCNLIPGKIEQQQLNVQFTEGEEVTLFVKGKSTIHLTGNYIFDSIPNANIDNNSVISVEDNTGMIDDEQIYHQQTNDQQINIEEISDPKTSNKKISNKKTSNKKSSDQKIIDQKTTDQKTGNKKSSNPVRVVRINSDSNSMGITIKEKIESNENEDDENEDDDDDNMESNSYHKKNTPSKTKRVNDDNDNDKSSKKAKKAKRTLKNKQSDQLNEPDESSDKKNNNAISVIDQVESSSQTTVIEKKKDKKKSKKGDDDNGDNNNKKKDNKENGKSRAISRSNTSYVDDLPSPPPHSPSAIPLTDNFEELQRNIPTFLMDINSDEMPSYIIGKDTPNEDNGNDDDDNNINTNKQSEDNIKYLPNGLIIEDKKVGTGRKAKTGDRVGLRYLGKVSKTNRIFDKNTNGKPFRFKLGNGDVIRGWDIGIAGMRVDGERKLTIPSNLAYGKRGMPPDIPPNSELIFNVKMVDLK